jgi:hypothetical protein
MTDTSTEGADAIEVTGDYNAEHNLLTVRARWGASLAVLTFPLDDEGGAEADLLVAVLPRALEAVVSGLEDQAAEAGYTEVADPEGLGDGFAYEGDVSGA